MPLERIEFSIAPYILTPLDRPVYSGRKIVWPHQFGFFRADVDTGAVETRVSVGYLQGIFPPPIRGHYVPGDDNQTVTQAVASPEWIVVNVHGLGKLIGPTGAPTVSDPNGAQAAFAWKNDGNLTFHGIVYAKSGYYWNWQLPPARIVGNELYAPAADDGMGNVTAWDVADLQTLAWTRHSTSAPADQSQKSIDGFTYTLATEGDPWAGGSFQSVPYVFTRAGSGDGSVYVPPPVVQPPPPLPPGTPPPVTEPPRTCPPGTFLNLWTGECDPDRRTPPPPPAPVEEDATSVLLLGARYRVQAEFEANGVRGFARFIPTTSDSAVAWFFSRNNLELLLKVVGDPEKPWFFVGGCTNVAVTLTLTDTVNGNSKVYDNPPETPFAPIQDVDPFGRA